MPDTETFPSATVTLHAGAALLTIPAHLTSDTPGSPPRLHTLTLTASEARTLAGDLGRMLMYRQVDCCEEHALACGLSVAVMLGDDDSVCLLAGDPEGDLVFVCVLDNDDAGALSLTLGLHNAYVAATGN